MAELLIEGGIPLVGNVTVSGSKYAALDIICASAFTNEDVLLDNVPKIPLIDACLEVFRSLGGSADWTGTNRLLLNSSKINKYEISGASSDSYAGFVLLFAGPLLYRFGKATLPKIENRYSLAILYAWKSLGVVVEEDLTNYYLSLSENPSTTINFKFPSSLGTASAILVSLFRQAEVYINTASEQSELDDLIAFCNELGATVQRLEPRKLSVKGVTIFKRVQFDIQPDKDEAAAFAVAALLTHGNVVISKVNRVVMIPFVNFLNKVGARFEFDDTSLKVWRNEERLESVQLTVAHTPGFLSTWSSLAVLLLSQVAGDSTVADTVNLNSFDYTKDLNRMGAKIEVVTPSQAGTPLVITDERFDPETSAEPETVARISGATKLHATKLNMANFNAGPVLALACLCADGKSELYNYEVIEKYMEQFFDKLKALGAHIWKRQA